MFKASQLNINISCYLFSALTFISTDSHHSCRTPFTSLQHACPERMYYTCKRKTRTFVSDFRFSQQWLWRNLSSYIKRRLINWELAEVSDEQSSACCSMHATSLPGLSSVSENMRRYILLKIWFNFSGVHIVISLKTAPSELSCLPFRHDAGVHQRNRSTCSGKSTRHLCQVSDVYCDSSFKFQWIL
jgi:hypothetical protein